MRRTTILFLILCLLGGTLAAKEDKKKEAEVDHVALAALLIKDGLYDRAETVLRNVDTTKKGIDLARYHTLRGLVSLQRSLFVEARDSFRRAVEAGQKEPIIHVYIAQSSYGIKDWKDAAAAIETAGATAEALPVMFSMLAQCRWNLGEKDKAWSALSRGEKRHPGYADLTRQKFFYLVELGLYQSAVEEGNRYLAKTEGNEKDYLLIGTALRQSRQYDKALPFLEYARVKFPGSEPVMLELARTYLDTGNILTAAHLFERASQNEPKFVGDAAELFRRAKKYYRALHLNTLITDQKEKLKQKLAIYLETESYELIAGMAGDLARVGLLDDDDIRYALGYSLFQSGEPGKAEAQLAKIQKPELFRRAAELRREMERCKNEPAHCGY